VARALIVGCGCRGRELGGALLAEGWLVRGTSRDPGRLTEVEAAGIEPALADPDRIGTILDLIGDVTLVYWLLGSALGEPEKIAAIHGERLERLFEEIVDTPVRGLVYEAAGRVGVDDLARGAEIVRAAADRWRIPVELADSDPDDLGGWLWGMLGASRRLTG
jgi:uncharacterized protein YbjT (DUF2867 family)